MSTRVAENFPVGKRAEPVFIGVLAPAKLHRQEVVHLRATERAVPLSGLIEREAGAEFIADVLPETLGVRCQSFRQETGAQLHRERLPVTRSPDYPVDRAGAGEHAAAVGEKIGAAMAAYGAGDTATGFERFMSAVGGPHHREVIEQALGPEGYENAVRQSAEIGTDMSLFGSCSSSI
jgi:hypothetical protein